MKNKAVEAVGYSTLISGFIVALVFSPVLTFWFAYFGGYILKVCVGESIASGFNIIFDTTRFTANLIPISCATLATVGKYFKSSQTNNNK